MMRRDRQAKVLSLNLQLSVTLCFFEFYLFRPSSPARRSHQKELGHRHRQDQGVCRHCDKQDLAEKLVESDPALAGKGPPRRREIHIALTGDDRRLDVPTKRPVKGHDGVLVRREQGRLHADEDSVSWNNEKQQARHEDDECEQRLPDHFKVRGEAEQPQGAREREDKEGGELRGGPVNAHRDPGSLEGLAERRQAVDEAQGGRRRYNNVRPDG